MNVKIIPIVSWICEREKILQVVYTCPMARDKSLQSFRRRCTHERFFYFPFTKQLGEASFHLTVLLGLGISLTYNSIGYKPWPTIMFRILSVYSFSCLLKVILWRVSEGLCLLSYRYFLSREMCQPVKRIVFGREMFPESHAFIVRLSLVRLSGHIIGSCLLSSSLSRNKRKRAVC